MTTSMSNMPSEVWCKTFYFPLYLKLILRRKFLEPRNSQHGIAFDRSRYIQYDIYQASPFLILASATFPCAFFAPGPFYFPCAVVDQTQ